MTEEDVGADFAHPARVYDYWLGGTDNFPADSGAVLIPRGRDAVLCMFNGRELVEPGLVLVSYWRPEGGDPGADADRAWAYGGVAAV